MQKGLDYYTHHLFDPYTCTSNKSEVKCHHPLAYSSVKCTNDLTMIWWALKVAWFFYGQSLIKLRVSHKIFVTPFGICCTFLLFLTSFVIFPMESQNKMAE